MKILTATCRTQGEHPGDYFWCVEGELVMPSAFICDRDAESPNGGCGCGRGWSGLSSQRGTTSAVVSDLAEVTRADYVETIATALELQRWTNEEATTTADRMAEIATSYPIGTVLGHRLYDLYIRSISPTRIISESADGLPASDTGEIK